MSLAKLEIFLNSTQPENAVTECHRTGQVHLASFLSKIYKPKIRVKMYCNWYPSADLVQLWSKMSQGNGVWNNIQIVSEEPADYYVIINSPPADAYFLKKKTILFCMEILKAGNPNPADFLKICHHEEYNNCEWHLSKTYSELLEMKIEKTKVLSTILSQKYTDPGHVKRIDFVKFLEKKGLEIDVYGSNFWEYKNYQRPLPYHQKDDGIFPYKYTFNVENHSKKNYMTEKLIDGILGECLVF
jgi:hypothetical protein